MLELLDERFRIFDYELHESVAASGAIDSARSRATPGWHGSYL